MYAIIETGGKQYRVAAGDNVRVEKLDAEIGAQIRFKNVLLVKDGDEVKVGQPILDGATVTGEVVKQDRDPKVVVFKMKRRKGYRRKTGHRQPRTEVRVTDIASGS